MMNKSISLILIMPCPQYGLDKRMSSQIIIIIACWCFFHWAVTFICIMLHSFQSTFFMYYHFILTAISKDRYQSLYFTNQEAEAQVS